MFDEDYIDQLIKDIFNGIITIESLPISLYTSISEKLLSAFELIEEKPSIALLNELTENIYMFSGAKVYQQINEISLLGNNEMIKSFSDFKKEALKIYEQYNKNWLQTEYSTTIAQGQNVVRWQQIEDQKKTLPYLEYSAVIDKNTSDICRPLDGIILPVDDKFWNKNTPANHWNCRCTLLQHDRFDATEKGITEKSKADEIEKEMDDKRQPLFSNNVGKDKVIFSKEHPYFDVAKEHKELAKNNFNLPIPEIKSKFKPKVFENWEINGKLDNAVFDLMKKEIEITEKNGGCYAKGTRTVNLSTKNPKWIKSIEYQERVIYHEIGHIIHAQNDIIHAGSYVSEQYKAHFSELKKIIKGNEAEISLKLKALKKTDVNNLEVFSKYGVKNYNDLNENILAVADSLEALTNGRYGWGHGKRYYSRLGYKEAEMFAHSIENTFKVNKVFEEIMPEVYKKSIEYIKTIR